MANLLADHGEAGLAAYRDAYPSLSSQTYAADEDVAQIGWARERVREDARILYVLALTGDGKLHRLQTLHLIPQPGGFRAEIPSSQSCR
mgnify:CR=1 FL=1